MNNPQLCNILSLEFNQTSPVLNDAFNQWNQRRATVSIVRQGSDLNFSTLFTKPKVEIPRTGDVLHVCNSCCCIAVLPTEAHVQPEDCSFDRGLCGWHNWTRGRGEGKVRERTVSWQRAVDSHRPSLLQDKTFGTSGEASMILNGFWETHD